MKYLIIAVFFFTSCSSFLKYKKETALFRNTEFEKKVNIVESDDSKLETLSGESSDPTKVLVESGDSTVVKNNDPQPLNEFKKTQNRKPKQSAKNLKSNAASTDGTARSAPVKAAGQTSDKKIAKVKAASKKSSAAVSSDIAQAETLNPNVRQPEMENSEGLGTSRRPQKDPFRVGETVTHDVSYLGASAGTMTLKVNSFAVVNGKKSYNFFINLKSNSFFTKIYAVDDQVQTYVDYETLVPLAFKLNIHDSGQVKEAREYFDNEKLLADYWEHRYSEKGGHEEKKLNWSILPYSQNPFSAIFYMRIFNYVDGQDYAFRVADDEKNVLFKAHVVSHTEISTAAGKFKAIKLKAEIYSRGNLAKASDFYLWLSDDDRKYLLRIEVKLPIGSLVSEATQISPGQP